MAIPLAVASARKRLCQRCPHYCHRPKWKWYRCTFGINAVADEERGPECGDDWWQGEGSVCGAGRWDNFISTPGDRVQVQLDSEDADIGPVDTDAYKAELASRQQERVQDNWRRQRPRLKAVLEHRANDDERAIVLIALTEFDAIPHWLAHEAAKEILSEQASTLGDSG